MKKLLFLSIALFIVEGLAAQSPQKMSYQCVVRNSAGALVPNQAVGMKISILKGSSTGTVVFSETYSPNPQTNANGLVTVEIGSGTASVGTLAGIDWSAGPYFLKTETDPAGGTTYTITGTSQLLSVPYALYAKTAANGFSGAWADITGKPAFATVATSGSYNDLLNKPTLFSGSYNDLTNKPVLFDGTWNGLTGKPAGLADGIDNVDDADNSITNEIQALNLSGTVLTLSNGGGSVTLPSSGGGDNWGTQTVVTNTTLTGAGTTASPLAVANTVITPTWANVQSKPAGFADGIDNVDDADNSITNEIQTLNLSGTTLSLSSGGGSVTLPSSGGGDNWGTQTVVTDATLAGNGTTATALKIAQQSAANGQVLKWSGTNWSPGNDLTGEFTLPYSGTTNTTGAGISVTNSSTVELSSGISGYSSSTTNRTFGITGRSESSTGVGVYGSAGSTTGINYGIYGETASEIGCGVYGRATSPSGINCGVYGRTASGTGYGVVGAGWTGVRGETTSSSGYGLEGLCTSLTGGSIAVRAIVTSSDGFSGYFQGGKFYISGNTGIGIDNPGAKLEVAGQVKITGGSPGAGKVLTSDATGLASWQATSTELILPYIGNGSSGASLFTVYNTSYGASIAGINNSNTGYSTGVVGQAFSPDGYGLYGFNSSGTAIYGLGSNTVGYGVFGQGASGVKGRSDDYNPGGIGVVGESNSNSGIGVYGITGSSAASGVVGVATLTTGASFGVRGTTNSSGGTGVRGYASSSSGTTFGVVGVVQSSLGYSGYFNGGRFFVSGNVGIANLEPGCALDVKGNRIKLSEGTEWIAMRTDGSTGFLDLTFSGGNLAIGGSNPGENILLNPATNGFIGIRTWSPQYDLDVTGNIRATGSVFYGGTAGAANGTAYTKPDYVFKDEYFALSTEQVEDFLERENHLPWVTSNKQEKEENGEVINMTRMSFETLEAVENIQLQLIEQQRLIREMKAQNDQLKTENAEMKLRLERLENVLSHGTKR